MNKSTPIDQLPSSNNAFIEPSAIDEDSAIQDILNQINVSSGGGGGGGGGGGQININNEQQQMQQMHQMQQMQQMQQLQQIQQMQQMQQQQQLPVINTEVNYKSFFVSFTDDIKIGVMIIVSVIIAHFLPIDKYLGNYFALDKIPYHHVIFLSIFSALIFLFIKKYISKI
jgi:hypothetical protein